MNSNINQYIDKEFSKTFSDRISDVTKQFRLGFVGYAQYYNDHMLALSSHSESTNHCMSLHDCNICLEDRNSQLWMLTEGKYSWKNVISPIICETLEQSFHLHHGITLIQHHDDCIEQIGISLTTDNSILRNELLSNNLTFIHIIQEIRKQCVDLLKHNAAKKIYDKSKPDIHNILYQKNSNNKDLIMPKLPASTKILNRNCEIVQLTQNDLMYLKLLMQLMTTKQISETTNKPSRTVEYHLQSLKNKLAVSNKKQLFELIKKNFLHYLLE